MHFLATLCHVFLNKEIFLHIIVGILFIGYLVLRLLNIKVKKYYSCEIDDDAKAVSQNQNKDNVIKYIGDAHLLTKSQIQDYCPIDLLLGGPPCNDLSRVNPERRHFGKKNYSILSFVLKNLQTVLSATLAFR